jgi:hypothetical protein
MTCDVSSNSCKISYTIDPNTCAGCNKDNCTASLPNNCQVWHFHDRCHSDTFYVTPILWYHFSKNRNFRIFENFQENSEKFPAIHQLYRRKMFLRSQMLFKRPLPRLLLCRRQMSPDTFLSGIWQLSPSDMSGSRGSTPMLRRQKPLWRQQRLYVRRLLFQLDWRHVLQQHLRMRRWKDVYGRFLWKRAV